MNNKEDNILIVCLLVLMVFLISWFMFLWGGVHTMDRFLDQCTHYEDKTIVCIIDNSNENRGW